MLSFAKSIDRLVKILESESDYANYWFDENKMIINPDKFQAILLDKRKSDLAYRSIKIENQNIQVVSDVKMLGVHIDHKLNFSLHIVKIWHSASNQLNAFKRRKRYLGKKERKVLADNFVNSNFNYYSPI